jgi:cobalt-zinc-cadmium efflux system outer membrane protein
MLTRFSFFLFCGAITATAQTPALSLDDAIRVAWTNDPTVAALTLTPDIARAREEQAGIRPNPELEVRASAPLTGNSEWEVGAGISQRLSRRERVEQARALARLGGEAAALQLAEQRRLVAGEVRRRYYAAIVSQARRETVAHTVDAQRTALAELERRRAAGEVSDAELILVRYELLRAEQALALADAELTAAQQRLRNRLRLPSAKMFAVTGDLNALLDRALPAAKAPNDASRPELALAAHAVREAEAALSLAKAESRQDWTVGGGVDFERRSNDATGHLENEPRLSVSASVPWPRRVANRGDILEKQAALRIAEARLTALREETAAEITAATEVVRVLQPVLMRQRTAIAETTALPDSLRIAAARGEVSSFQLAQLRQQHLAIETDFLAAAARYADALAEAETLAGLVPEQR